jgi:hypothetical protein
MSKEQNTEDKDKALHIGSVISRFLCEYGVHRWVFARGVINKYYECKRCKKRKAKECLGVYQPIDIDWLNGL